LATINKWIKGDTNIFRDEVSKIKGDNLKKKLLEFEALTLSQKSKKTLKWKKYL